VLAANLLARRRSAAAPTHFERSSLADPPKTCPQVGARQALSRPQASLRDQLVADEADKRGLRQSPEMGELLRIDQPLGRLVQGDAGGDEDRKDDREPGDLLGPNERRRNAIPTGTAVSASLTLWIRSASSATEPVRTRIPACTGAAAPQDSETERDGLEARPRAHDRTVDETVRVPVRAVSLMFVLVLMLARL
jgi:hypothetical protein